MINSPQFLLPQSDINNCDNLLDTNYFLPFSLLCVCQNIFSYEVVETKSEKCANRAEKMCNRYGLMNLSLTLPHSFMETNLLKKL